MPRKEHITGWKVALVASTGLAGAFAALGGLSTGYTWRKVGLLAIAGALLGAIAAPDLEPEAFRHPIAWQMFFGILSSLLVAFQLKLDPIGYFSAAIIGMSLGYFARHWTKYIDVP
jgi:hypothetical protein